jgi:hypothetical protein
MKFNALLVEWKAVPVLVCSIVLISCGHGPEGLSAQTDEAMKRFRQAFHVAFEARNEPALTFDPRYLDVQRANSDLKISASSESDRRASAEAQDCTGNLKLYRDSIRLRDEDLTARIASALVACEERIYRFSKD